VTTETLDDSNSGSNPVTTKSCHYVRRLNRATRELDCSMMIASRCVDQFDFGFCCGATTVIAPTGEHVQVSYFGDLLDLPVLDKFADHADDCAYRRLHALPGSPAGYAMTVTNPNEEPRP
jgi:hypothetical protein